MRWLAFVGSPSRREVPRSILPAMHDLTEPFLRLLAGYRRRHRYRDQPRSLRKAHRSSPSCAGFNRQCAPGDAGGRVGTRDAEPRSPTNATLLRELAREKSATVLDLSSRAKVSQPAALAPLIELEETTDQAHC